MKRSRRNRESAGTLSVSQPQPTVRVFSYAEVRAATNDFSTLIGKGGFGSVYKGIIDDGSIVAVKRLDSSSNQGHMEFWTEIEVLSRFRHRNVVSLIGYCGRARGKLFLFYEFMAFGSLNETLFKSDKKGLSLNWLQRLKICIGAARGLDYLHCGGSSKQGVIHGDVKSSNIVLDENFEAKIADFGISKFVSQDEGFDVVTTVVKGTFGYLDPAYYLTCHLTRKSDVYSFGVVLFEVLSGRKAVDHNLREENRLLTSWAPKYVKEGKLEYIIDPNLSGEILRSCLIEFSNIAAECVHTNVDERPTMAEVLARLEYSLTLQETKDSSQVERVVYLAGDFDGSSHKSPRDRPTLDITEGKGSAQLDKNAIDSFTVIFNRNPRRDATMARVTATITFPLAQPDAKNHSSEERGSVTGNIHDQGTADSRTTKRKIAYVKDTLSVVRSTTETLLVASGRIKKIRFSLVEIQRATHNFDKDLVLGRGGKSGKVYKGLLDDGSSTVAIKQLNSTSNRSASKFRAEIDLLLEFRHRHLVSLIGYCNQGPELMLVFEYVPRGSLGEHLHEADTPLSWVQRLKICIGAARGLDYLHTGTPVEDGVVHGNIKSSNILLDDKWETKLSGLSLSNIIHENESHTHVSTCVVGNYGYNDPDYFRTGRLTRKTDVYSIGVLLFEVMCGRKPSDSRLEDEQIGAGLVKWAQHCLEEKTLDRIIDPRLSGQVVPNHLLSFAQIADQCLHTSPKKRPTMAEVVTRLEHLLTLQENAESSAVEEKVFASAAGSMDDQEISNSSFVESESFNVDESYSQYAAVSSMEREVVSSSKVHEQIHEITQLADPADKMKFRRKVLQFVSRVAGVFSGATKKVKLLKLDTGGDSSVVNLVNKDLALNEEMEQKLKQVDYLQEGELLNRMKDFLHLILFYPMKPDAEINFPSLIGKMSSFSDCVRRLQESPNNGDPGRCQLLADVASLFHDIQEHLADAASSLVPYLPEDMVQNMYGCPDSGKWSAKHITLGPRSELPPSTSGTKLAATRFDPAEIMLPDFPAIHSGAVDSAICRASGCIKEMTFRKLGISGIHAKEVTKALRNNPEIKSKFGIVLNVYVSMSQSIGEIKHDIEKQVDLWQKENQRVEETGIPSPELYNCILFLDCSDDSIDLHDFECHFTERFRYLQIVVTTGSINAYRLMDVSLEIRTGDHLLPWNMFFSIVGQAVLNKSSDVLQHMAARLVEECHGHLLANILLARALKGVTDISVWELALHELTTSQQQPLSLPVEAISDIMVGVLRFIWPRKHLVSQRCLQLCAEMDNRMEIQKSSLISSWVEDGIVETQKEGEDTFEDLISSFLLEKAGETSVKMRDETRFVLLCKFIPRVQPLSLKLDGLALTEMPRVEEWDVMEIQLSNNELSELPESPNCPILLKLSLRLNPELAEIPLTFFERMLSLQILDLSSTSIKYLPPSVSKLVALREFFIRNCALLTELPPEIGALRNLKLFDLEGTELICLPEELQNLARLECLKVSFYRCADQFKESKKLKSIVPDMSLSSLSCLKELSIYVDLDVEWWKDEVKCIIDQLSKLRHLKTLRLHIPTLELLHIFLDTMSPERGQIHPCLSQFRLIVGSYQQHILSYLPLDLEQMFLKLEKCLTYSNGEGNMELIARALKHATAFYLDRHWTIQSLTPLINGMDKLEFCLLVGCNEMQRIVNGNELYEDGDDAGKIYTHKSVLGWLRYLSIHYMKNLSCIWKGPIPNGCLSSLITLTLHVCPELTTIFTVELLGSLMNLKYLIVEGCPKINSLVSVRSSFLISFPFLPNLKNISLLDLPELFSISSGVYIAQKLERMVIYNCPKLKSLSTMEVSSTGIKEIKGEIEWWDDLQWHKPDWSNGQPDYLTRVFVPLGKADDLMDELAEERKFLQQLIQDESLDRVL